MKDNSCLLVIDMQNVYKPGEKWECPRFYDCVKFIEDFMNNFNSDDIFFTQFISNENPEGVWKEYNKKYKDVNESRYLNEECEELEKYLTRDNLYLKSEFSSMKNLELKKKVEKYDNVYVTGVVADCCILSTICELIDMGKKVYYCTDGIAGLNKKTEDATIIALEGLSPLHIEFI